MLKKGKTFQCPAVHRVTHKTSFHSGVGGLQCWVSSSFLIFFSWMKSPCPCALYLEAAEYTGDVKTIRFSPALVMGHARPALCGVFNLYHADITCLAWASVPASLCASVSPNEVNSAALSYKGLWVWEGSALLFLLKGRCQ